MAAGAASRVGEWVEVRPLAEIMATLDGDGALDGMPFMPEMARFAGQRFPIFKSAHKTCDPTGATELRRLPDTAHLPTRCDGAAHDGCQARCLLYWKRAWLRPVDGPRAAAVATSPAAGVDLTSLAAATRRTSETGEIRYRCQVTEIAPASTPLPLTALRPYFEDVASGNLPPLAFAREVLRVYARAIVRKGLNLIGLDARRFRAPPVAPTTKAAAKLDLQPGELARVRPAAEILATLNPERKNRGLSFEQEMLRHCGKTHRVLARVSRIIDEKSGRMIVLANDCIALEDVICHGLDNRNRLFCPRGPYFYWREAWLERVAPAAAAGR